MKTLVALSGKRFSGKDTLAAMIVASARAKGVLLVTHAFADESKRMFAEREAARGAHVDLERMRHDRDYKEACRPRLTAFTMEALAADPLVFCRSVADRIEREAGPSLVTDVRLRLEVDHLRSRFDLHLIRLVRSDGARARSGWTYVPDKDDHPTETELDDPALWDEIVHNDGSLDDLAAKAEAIVRARITR